MGRNFVHILLGIHPGRCKERVQQNYLNRNVVDSSPFMADRGSFVFNYYHNWSYLVLGNWNIKASFLHVREGVTQGGGNLYGRICHWSSTNALTPEIGLS